MTDAEGAHLDDEVVRALHEEHGAALMGLALRLTGDRQRAEEVVQDAFVRAWQHPEALDGTRGSPRAYLLATVRNLVIDRWRRDAVRPATTGEDALALVGVLGQADRVLDAMVVRDAVRRLSFEHRQILQHAFVLDEAVDETARVLGIPPGTVKSRTYYALRALRAALEELGYLQ